MEFTYSRVLTPVKNLLNCVHAIALGCILSDLYDHAPCKQRQQWLKISLKCDLSHQTANRRTLVLASRIAPHFDPPGPIPRHLHSISYLNERNTGFLFECYTAILTRQKIMPLQQSLYQRSQQRALDQLFVLGQS